MIMNQGCVYTKDCSIHVLVGITTVLSASYVHDENKSNVVVLKKCSNWGQTSEVRL